ncbi:hypothetical protein ACMA1I_06225 [Pontibacter sp. 13R65]|uniref:hypothetical protein n=1 Tax=Pontibacter sp. 13R65 TaxID=3127458 RepID=UPI00301D2D52
MRINNISDEELDNLFRKSAEGFDPPYDPEAWRAMEQKLDTGKGHAAGFWRVLPLLLLLLLIGTVPLYDVRQGQQPVSVALPDPENTPHLQPRLPAPAAVTGETKLPGDNSSYRGLQASVAQAAHPGAPAPGSQEQPESRNTFGIRKKKAAASVAIPHNVVPTTATASSFPGADKVNWGTADLPGLPPHAAPADTSGGVPVPVLADMEKPAAPEAKDTVPQPGKDEKKASFKQTSAAEKQPYLLQKIHLMLAVAPDLTMVKFKDPSVFSSNAGLLVALPLSRRLSLVSGVLWAKKRYSAQPQDYSPSPDYWDGKYLPDKIDATCKVLDIPLNMRVLLLERGKNQLAVQAGLSSYIMLQEEYLYNYERYVSYPYTKTWVVENENRHWFAVQNLSVAYTRRLSSAFAVGAEPFVKIPFSSIGAGHVKLTSAGVLLTAGYTFDLKK